MILVLAQYNTPRLQYVLSELLERRMGSDYKIVTDAEVFATTVAPLKINYSPQHIGGAIHIVPQGLLSETGIKDKQVGVENSTDWEIIFWSNNGNEIPFDVFAATFFLLSRYEEYVNPVRDEHGRFEAKNSVAYQHGFLQLPLIEVWVETLKTVFLKHNSSLVFATHSFKNLSTIDVDFAYLYKGVGLKRWIGKLLKAIVTLKWNDALTQVLVSAGIKRDPYDTFGFIHANTTHNPAYFLLMNHSGGYDKASDVNALTSLINTLKQQADFIGIHPSYQSNIAHHLLNKEIELLKKLTGLPITHSRNHFLKLSLPHTYHRLTDAGIQHDYTMLYADNIGFRASTCLPFYFYDVTTEQATNLTVYSTCAMDVTLKNYLSCPPDEAIKILTGMESVVKKYNGMFITLWHNSSLCDNNEWAGWKQVYMVVSNN